MTIDVETTDTKEAMELGQIAAANEEPLSANPFDGVEQPEHHEAWREGHDYVTSTDEDGVIKDHDD